jgi:hypothetical protein
LEGGVNLLRATEGYSRTNEQYVRDELVRQDKLSFKKGQDLELAQGERLILRDTNGVRYSITVNTSGALVVTAL